MGNKRWTRRVLTGFVALSLATTSLGGTFATAALAATPEAASQDSGSDDSKAVVGGIVALGLLTMLAKGGDKSGDATAIPGKTPAPASQPALTSTSSPVPRPTPAPAPQPQPAPAPIVGAGVSADEQQALNLLNADRKANGLAPLRMNAKLAGLAQNYAQDMINRNFFAHNNPEGQTPFDRMRQRGISFGYAGENLAINTSVANAEQAFMNSPGHRANILNNHYTQVGLGVRYNKNGSVYVVQEFTDG